MTTNFNVKHYNQLPSLIDARKTLQCELGDLDFEKEFLHRDDIRQLFLEGAEARRFGIFVTHRHVLLEEGERIITTLVPHDIPPREPLSGFHSIMQPRPAKGFESRRIVASSWMLVDGQFLECEHKEVDDDRSDRYLPPSRDFFGTFQTICTSFGITVLGIFALNLVSDAIDGSNVFLRERFNERLRSWTTRVVGRSDIEEDMISSSWIPGFAKELWLVGVVEDVTTLGFNYQSYNNLRMVHNAHSELQRQVEQNGMKRFCEFFQASSDLRRLFLEGPEAGRFGIFLAHRHHSLQEGERMVMTLPPPGLQYETVSAPSFSKEAFHPESNSGIVATSWMLVKGRFEEYEHRVLHSDFIDSLDHHTPPPPRFFREFRRICGIYHFDILGIFSRDLPYGWLGARDIMDIPPDDFLHVFVETTVRETREQMTRRTPRPMLDRTNTSQSAWILLRVAGNAQARMQEVERQACTKEKHQTECMKKIVQDLEDRVAAISDVEGLGHIKLKLELGRMKLAELECMQGSGFCLLTPGLENSVSIDLLNCEYNCQEHINASV